MLFAFDVFLCASAVPEQYRRGRVTATGAGPQKLCCMYV